uniref:ADP-ribosylation factor-like protein 2-binding protein n=1 Tax=Nyctereutes procyonoides TaxID=34880 RepID=UPI0024448AEF|nr:ADP-ribosylation factor-like protein 2-binding protein [Nyctereutes procyonoides]
MISNDPVTLLNKSCNFKFVTIDEGLVVLQASELCSMTGFKAGKGIAIIKPHHLAYKSLFPGELSMWQAIAALMTYNAELRRAMKTQKQSARVRAERPGRARGPEACERRGEASRMPAEALPGRAEAGPGPGRVRPTAAAADALVEESFALSLPSASDVEFDAVVGYLEDVVMDDEFPLLQRNFMGKYNQELEDAEEDARTYTPVFNEYVSLVEKYIEEQLPERLPGFNMAAFTTTLQHPREEVAGDVWDVLLTFTGFLAFKEMFLDYRAEKEGRGLDSSSGLVVTSLCKSQNVPASENDLRPRSHRQAMGSFWTLPA